MKNVLLILTLAVINFTTACTKDKEKEDTETVVKTYGVPGVWIGTYTVTQHPELGSRYAAVTFYPDGTAVARTKAGNNSYYAAGTWTLSGTALTASWTSLTTPVATPVTQTASFTFNAAEGTLTNGTWQDVINNNGGMNSGTFSTLEVVKNQP